MTTRTAENARCANCAIDRSKDLDGLCSRCESLKQQGYVVKIKETMDKDLYSCGCYGRPEGVYLCSQHTEDEFLDFKP